MAKIILVAGCLAGGKTTFSLRLAEALGLPVFNKDKMKNVLGGYLPIPNRAESLRLSDATVALMLHTAEILMRTGAPLILESNFKADEAARLEELIGRCGYHALTYVFAGDLRVLHRRFLEREGSPAREPANRMGGLYDDYAVFAENVRPLADFCAGGEIIRVDTTDFQSVDFDGYIEQARRFIERADEA